MKMYYIPPTIATVKVEDMGWLQEVIHNAIQSSIVDPFQAWCLSVWNGFVSSSLAICTTAALISLIFYMCGCKRARNYIIIPIIVYIFIRMIDYMIIVGF